MSASLDYGQNRTERSNNSSRNKNELQNRNGRKALKSSLCCECCLAAILLGGVGLAIIITLWLTITPRNQISTALVMTTNNTLATSSSTTTSTSATTIPQICNPTCLNGGTCISSINNTCVCITDVWTGPQCQTPVRILWKFENDLNDVYGNFPGSTRSSLSYLSPGINVYGSCLYFNGSAGQSVTIVSPPFLNMAYTSFSLSLWIRATTFRTGCAGVCCDNALFGQLDLNSPSRSLHLIVRNRTSYFGFYSNDTIGRLVLKTARWYHLAFVYDYSTLTQSIYVNGELDASKSGTGPYAGIRGNLTIGNNAVCTGQNYWDGCLDEISYVGRAKNASEVLADATLTISYGFNNNLNDNGPLGINGSGTNIQYSVLGFFDACLNLSINPSYVQGKGATYLGYDEYPYSFTIWVKPTIISSGTIIHVVAGTASSSWSFPMLGLQSTGHITAYGCSNNGPIVLTGPVLNSALWTHIAVTYSPSTSLQLWINGTQIAVSTPFNSSTPDIPVDVILGTSPNLAGICSTSIISVGQYVGLMDEFRLFSRQLSASEIVNIMHS